ncbi:hypothetical protein OEA41_002732 [Lepraria neglecta]|uniref:DNA-directed RNA polymerase III subunit RPC9 n=1 Tax=Lepraria neglecta TaxID=209136 RepID=A0AAE0DIQ1_9LECA|nr:hypothetical protein OEA41_002732 [Lepraria neglecta]
MKILETQSAVLSNYEVLAHLTESRAKPRTTPQTHTNVSTVIKEINTYLTPPPDSRSPIPRYQQPHYSDQTIRTLVTRLQAFNLTKSEVLMVLNLRPQELTLLDCVVEECDERFTQERQEEILRIVQEVLGGEENGVDGEEGMNGANGGGGEEGSG